MRVIITGASMGIGAGIARVMGKHGCSVGLLARSIDKLEAVAAEVHAAGGNAFVRAADLRDAKQTEHAIEGLVSGLEGVDALVNNAGLVTRKDVFDISVDEWHAMIETNINGVFYGARAVLPTMRAQGAGHIVNVSSISGRFPLKGGSGYAATKFAVTGFSQSLFQEVREFGIKVTTVYPGSVDSASHRHDPDADHDWKVRPEEVGDAVWHALDTRPGCLVSEVEVRPVSRPPSK